MLQLYIVLKVFVMFICRPSFLCNVVLLISSLIICTKNSTILLYDEISDLVPVCHFIIYLNETILKGIEKVFNHDIDYMCNKFKFKNVSFSNALKQLFMGCC